jgi:3D (Asp-Asp-Asp) domain-containing protein
MKERTDCMKNKKLIGGMLITIAYATISTSFVHKQHNEIQSLQQKNITLEETSTKRSEKITKLEGNVAYSNFKISELNNEINSLNEAVEEQNELISRLTSNTMSVDISVYMNNAEENGGLYGGHVKTKMGDVITNEITYNGMNIIAADPTIIPMNSIVSLRIEGYPDKICIVRDIGGAIKGNKIDLLTNDRTFMDTFGRRDGELTILSQG